MKSSFASFEHFNQTPTQNLPHNEEIYKNSITKMIMKHTEIGTQETKKKLDEAKAIEQKTINAVHVLNQQVMATKNRVTSYRFYDLIIIFSILTCMCISLMVYYQKLNKDVITLKFLIIIIVTIAALYFLILTLHYKNMLRRRRDDWSKYIFKHPKVQTS